FFFQAEDGIRDFHVTGVQTCALPIFLWGTGHRRGNPLGCGFAVDIRGGATGPRWGDPGAGAYTQGPPDESPPRSGLPVPPRPARSEERRVGKECRDRRPA